MSVVNLFIVGMPKAGTTSLHRYLSQHPEIYMSEDKEPHYFAVDLLAEGEAFHGYPKYTRYGTLTEYHRLFDNVKNEAVVGESSVFYLFSQRAGAEIQSYNPAAKIIIMIREPVSFLYSLHSQGLYSGNETEPSFERALQLQGRRERGEEIPSTVHFPSRLFYTKHAQLTSQIKRYLDLFPKEQIRVILFDDFKANTASEYRKTLQFLSVDPSFQADFTQHNPNTTVYSKKLMRVLQDPANPVARVAKRVAPGRVLRKGKSLIKRINTQTTVRAPLEPDLRDTFKELARPTSRVVNF